VAPTFEASRHSIAAAGAAQLAQLPEAFQKFDLLPDAAYVDLPVVARLLSCSAPTVWRRVRQNVIPAPHKFGRLARWNCGELRRALASV